MTRLPDRFASWIAADPDTGCWLWTGSTCRKGYARYRADGRRYQAHRYSYEILVGPIPEGLQLDHTCRVRNCVNPRHLEPVTSRENTIRGVSPVAEHARATHCPRGHPFAGDNLYVSPRGFRTCRTCKAQFWGTGRRGRKRVSLGRAASRRDRFQVTGRSGLSAMEPGPAT